MNGIKRFKRVFLFLYLLCSVSCVNERFADVSAEEDPVKVGFSNRAFVQEGVTVSSFRIIAFNSGGSLEINKTLDDLIISGNNLTCDLRPGMYTLFAIANEQTAMSSLLDGCTSEGEVDAVRINMIENQDSTTLPLAWKETIYVRQKPGGSNMGQISLDNINWQDQMLMEMKRLASKLELHVRKEGASDVVSVKTVTIINIPKYSYIAPVNYEGEYYSTLLNTNYDVTDDLSLMIDRIFPEHIPISAEKNTFLEFDMDVNGSMQKALIEIGQLDRNKIYRYEILVKRRETEIENVEIVPWQSFEMDGLIDDVKINFSSLTVPYSFEQESKVYFTTKNIPKTKLRLSTDVFSADGNRIGALEDLFDTSVTAISYTYDERKKLGNGVLTIRRNKPSGDSHKLKIYASGLNRMITVAGMDVAGSYIYMDDSQMYSN